VQFFHAPAEERQSASRSADQEGKRRDWTVRLISGLIMFAFVTSHFLNHALGLISLDLAEDAMWYLYRVYTAGSAARRSTALSWCIFSLALYALCSAKPALTAPEAVQYTLGFPRSAAAHRACHATRVSDTFLGGDFGYYRSILTVYFHEDPWKGVLQAIVLVVAWVHACIGLRFWLA